MSDELDYSDSVTVKFTKVKYLGKPTYWAVEIDDGTCGGTAPTFYGVWDIAYEIITGDTGEYDSEHNTWIDFDANKH